MTRARLVLRNLLYHWRGNLAVLLGVMVGSAVLTGAMLVGDSLTGSLLERAEQQLGWIDHVLITPHLLHEGLASEVAAEHACPALLLQGTAGNAAQQDAKVGDVAIVGVTQEFWYQCELPERSMFWGSDSADEAVISRKLADDLHVAAGDKVVLEMPKLSPVPRESSMGHRDADRARTSVTVTVAKVLDAEHFGSHFSVRPQSGQPRNVFLPLAAAQQVLQDAADQDRTKFEIAGHINAIFARGQTDHLQSSMRTQLTMDDWGLRVRDPETRTKDLFSALARRPGAEELRPSEYRGRIAVDMVDHIIKSPESNITRKEVLAYFEEHRPYMSLESRQLILDEGTVDAALLAAKDLGVRAAPTFVYLADSLAAGEESHPYVLVAAVDPDAGEPLVPAFLKGLKDDEIAFAETVMPLLSGVTKAGATIRMTYYDPEKEDDPPKNATFTLKGFFLLNGAGADPDMTPDIPGVTDQKDLDWDVPKQLHYDEKRLRPEDRRFWDNYRTTPRAYITLNRGRELWKNRFGNATSIRMVPIEKRRFEKELLGRLDLDRGGMSFDAVRANRLQSAEHGTDFSVLFLSFSIFIIVAALLLVGLLLRLNLDRRSSEVGLLLALGYRRATVRWLLLIEGVLVSIVGALVGLVFALGYARLLLLLLGWWWPGHLDHSFLKLHIRPLTAVTGFVSILVVTVLTVFWVLRGQSKLAASALLAGATSDSTVPAQRSRRSVLRYVNAVTIGAASLVLAVISLSAGFMVRDHEAQAGSFFSAGMFLLVAMLATLWSGQRRQRHALVHGQGPLALGRLAVRNAGRNPLRSLLTAGLLACAAFVVVAVQSFRKDAGKDLDDKHSGTGGLSLLAETDLPVYHDLSSSLGRKELLDQFRMRLQEQGKPAPEIDRPVAKGRDVLKDCTIFSCRLRPGDDASCLNLSQPRQPRILGVPESFIDDDRLRFGDSLATNAEEKANPWLLLKRPAEDGVIPVIADATTVEWTLHSKLGGKIVVPGSGSDNMVTLQIVALLEDSIFQSELLMSSNHFEQAFPDQGGYRVFMLAAPAADRKMVQDLFTGSGYDVTQPRDRLASYLEVENTYLATFQALGSLGLVLGTVGLAVVLLRSVWERRGELALLRALGFRNGQVRWLVMAENAWLLFLGLAMGTAAALLAVAPQLAAGAGSVPWPRLLMLLAVVAAVGLVAGTVAVGSALKADLIPALRRE